MAILKDIANLDRDSVLGALGLQRSRADDWIGPATGGLVVGLVLGAALALLFAPQSGQDLRGAVRRRVDETKDGLRSAFRMDSEKAEPVQQPAV